MTDFNDTEISTQDGQPASLYRFVWDKTVWAYTNADRDITRDETVNGATQSITYKSVAISDEGMVQGGSSNNALTVNIPRNLPVFTTFQVMPPAMSIWLTVRRVHLDTGDAPIYWLGLVANVTGKDAASAEVVGTPISATFNRAGTRVSWSKTCPHTIYDSGCKLDPANFAKVAPITAVSGNQVSVTVVDGMMTGTRYRGGFFEWEVNADGTIERRMIEEFVSDTTDANGVRTFVLQTFGVAYPLAAGISASVIPACDLTPEVCDGTFDNLPNHGGFKFMAGRSPFDGEPVF